MRNGNLTVNRKIWPKLKFRRTEFGHKLPAEHSNKLTFKGLLCALSRHPHQHRRGYGERRYRNGGVWLH